MLSKSPRVKKGKSLDNHFLSKMNNYWDDGRPTPLELVSNTWCPLKFMFKIPEHLRTFKDIFSVFPGQNIKEFKDIPG